MGETTLLSHPAGAFHANEAVAILNQIASLRVATAISDLGRQGCPTVYINPAFERLSRRSVKDVVGHSLLTLYDEHSYPQLLGARKAAMNHETERLRVRMVSRRGDGSDFNEVVHHRVVMISGFVEWLVSCHFNADMDSYPNRSRLVLRNFELRARNTFRLIESAIMLACVQRRTKAFGEMIRNRGRSAVMHAA
ncbi:MAG: hypothetical protein AAGK00_10405 [Pseudomonadota bacterium]